MRTRLWLLRRVNRLWVVVLGRCRRLCCHGAMLWSMGRSHFMMHPSLGSSETSPMIVQDEMKA